jgi:septal ring factor EnvC (AmiA/AmiB activator)
MSVSNRLRRPAVVLGVVLVLLAGAATIRAAAAWTAASSPLTSKPPSIEQLRADLVTEQARSDALQARLDELVAGSTELTAALQAARDQIARDATEAETLRANLTSAQKKLSSLERSIRQAGATAPRTVSVASPDAVSPAQVGEEREHEGDDDD